MQHSNFGLRVRWSDNGLACSIRCCRDSRIKTSLLLTVGVVSLSLLTVLGGCASVRPRCSVLVVTAVPLSANCMGDSHEICPWAMAEFAHV